MSVSITMIPLAIALRIVMGKNSFDTWIQSMQIKIPTTFINDDDLVLSVRRCGLDCNKWGGSYKTHVGNGKSFFFWNLIDGKWTAIFSKSDSKEMIRSLINEMESTLGRSLFLSDPETNKPLVIQTKTFPTNFRDGALLQQTLLEHQIPSQLEADGTIQCDVGPSRIRFLPTSEGGSYQVEVLNVPNAMLLHEQLAIYDTHYKALIQQKTCERIKKEAFSKNMMLSREEVLEDQSILLVLTIN